MDSPAMFSQKKLSATSNAELDNLFTILFSATLA